MPVGIPKIAFEFPDDDDDNEKFSYLELYQRLYEERLVFIGRNIDSRMSNQVISALVYLNMKYKEDQDVYVFINSPGGDILSGLGIYDTMQLIEAEVQTVCLGMAASMASVILAGGKINKRTAFPYSKVMLHEPACSFFEDQAASSVYDARELELLNSDIMDIYIQRTMRSSAELYRQMSRDSYMTAYEAEKFRIVDIVSYNVT